MPLKERYWNAESRSWKRNTNNGDGVVEQGLAEDDDVEDFVDVDLVEDGEHGHRIDGRYQRREDEDLQRRDLETVDARQAARPQRQAWNTRPTRFRCVQKRRPASADGRPMPIPCRFHLKPKPSFEWLASETSVESNAVS